MFFALTRVSGNAKTGPIPTSMSSAVTCPDTCALKNNGCYANGGPTAIHWRILTKGERGVNAEQFFNDVRAIPRGSLWRHNVAGDLPHVDGVIDSDFLGKLVHANNGKRGFTYTHHVLSVENAELIRKANEYGFTVNVSCDTAAQAVDTFKNRQVPVVTILPLDAPNVQIVDDVKIVACPAEKSDKVQCANCQLCAIADREYIIGFRAHGVSKKKVDIIARG